MARSVTDESPKGDGVPEARKEVRFAEGGLAREVPREALKDTPLRRQSTGTRNARLSGVTTQDEEEGRCRPTYADFKREVTDDLEGVRYKETTKTLQNDLQVKLRELADLYASKTRSGKPGMPISCIVDSNDLSFDGVIDVYEFQKLVREHPEEMFRELKLRSLMAAAYSEQVRELHVTAKTLDNHMKIIHDWVPALYGSDAGNDEACALSEREEQLISEVALQTGRATELQDKLAESNQMIVDLIARNRANQAATPRSGREETPRSEPMATDRRSGKVPDPPVFYNEEDRDTDDFEEWYRDIENKLEVNADHYPTDRARQAYVESRLGGKAKRDLAPYLRATHPDPVNSSAKLLSHLWAQYNNPNKEQDSLDDYDELKLQGRDFLSFKNDFVRLAGECGKPRSSWKTEFNRKLTVGMQKTLLASYLDPTVDFDQYVRLGQQLAKISQRASERQPPAPKSKSGNPGPKRPSARETRAGGAAGDKGGGNKKLTKDEVAILTKENRCFHCREKGHMKQNCPKLGNAGEATLEARLRALEAAQASNPPESRAADLDKSDSEN